MNDERVERDCPYCGERILVVAKKCKYCHEIVDPTLRALEEIKSKQQHKIVLVDECGQNIVVSYQQSNSCPNAEQVIGNKNRLTYVLLGVFLGGLGVHNFYAGYSGRGISQLLITLFLGWLILPLIVITIWVIIEVCIVQVDAQGYRFKNN